MQSQGKKIAASWMLSVIIGGGLLSGATSSSAAEEHKAAHKHFKGEVIEKVGSLGIKTEDGTTYQLRSTEPGRQGRALKPGDKVDVTVNENNAVVDVHLEAEKGKHKLVTGKLIHVGQMKEEIKLSTAEGERTFPLLLQETKTRAIAEGTEVTVELNEAGTVIDLHKGKH